MKDSIARSATYQDVLDAPEGTIAQIVDGVLETQPRPAIGHAVAATQLSASLVVRFGRGGSPGGWVILYEPELHLGEDVLVPDIAGWRVERMPRVPNTPFISLAPDWVCEVLSPANAGLDRVRKMRVYHRESVGHVWLVDPREKTLEVYPHESDNWRLLVSFEGEDSVRAEPFEAEAIELGLLWIPDEPEGSAP
jgi:Uma2 family endonuclease